MRRLQANPHEWLFRMCARFLTGAIEEVSKKSGLNQSFLGLIVLPIAGNACEHITAVFVAVKNKMDLAIGVALGSSIQACPLCRHIHTYLICCDL